MTMKTVEIMDRSFDEIMEYLAENDFCLTPEEEDKLEDSILTFQKLVPLIRGHRIIETMKKHWNDSKDEA